MILGENHKEESMKEYTARVFVNHHFVLGEGPIYDPRFDRLSWVDIKNEELWSITKNDEPKVFSVGQPIGAAVPIADSNDMLLALKDGLYRYSDEGLSLVTDMKADYKEYRRSNDAKADPFGRLWFGSLTMDETMENSGSLYCYDKGHILVKEANTKISNGMAWSKDCTRFFFSDTPYHSVFVYDYDLKSGGISNRRILCDMGEGEPDGLCIDEDDNLWIAVWGGHRVEKRSGQTGELLEVVHVDATNVTSCAFCGDILYITSSGEGLDGEHEGCLFSCKVDARGVNPDYVMM